MDMTPICFFCKNQVQDMGAVFECARCVHPICDWCEPRRVRWSEQHLQYFCTNCQSEDDKLLDDEDDDTSDEEDGEVTNDKEE